MASLGCDYSYARPGGASLQAAGVAGVGRYLADDGRGITAGEYADLQAHGIGVWLTREGSATGMLSGFAKGVADAQLAEAQIAVVGLPADSVVYATADFDVNSAQFGACDDYLRGFASVIGVGRTGIYGGTYYLNHVHALGLANWFWICGSTSFAHGQTPQFPVHLQQTVQTPPVPGTDHDYIYDTSTFAGLSATAIRTDDDEMLSTEAQTFLTNLAADIKSAIRREGRGRLYYCATPPAGLPQFVCIFWERDAKEGDNILYATGETQADHWNTLYSQTSDTVAQAKAAALSAAQFQTLVNLALGTDSAFTNPVKAQ